MPIVVTPSRPRSWRWIALALLAPPLALSSLPSTAAAQDEGGLPACSTDRTTDCRLPGWPGSEQRDRPSPFGDVEGLVWFEDEVGDAPGDGIDILAAGVGRVTIDQPKPIRKADGTLRKGKVKKAVPKGTSLLVRVVVDRAPDTLDARHASIHVATDADGSRSDNAPSIVAEPDFPFAGSQDIYSLTWASTTGETTLQASDLAKGWYKAKTPFAASWATPTVIDFLIKPATFGQGFRVITNAAAADGGYDSLTLGPSPVPVDGRVGLAPACVEGSISQLPYVVPRVVDNKEVVRDVEAPASWQGGAALPLTDENVRSRVAALIAERDADGDGRASLPAWVNLFQNGTVVRQRADLELALDGEAALIATELGLLKRGYNVLRNIELDETGDRAVDAWLGEATDALREAMPPFRVNKRAGLLTGGAIGACIPWLEAPLEPVPSDPPAATIEPSVAPIDAAESA